MSRLAIGLIGLIGLPWGCKSSSSCKTVNMDPLLAGAASVRVDIYDSGSARCDAGLLAIGAGPPLVSQKFAGGQPLQLSLPPGARIVVVSTFSDADGVTLTSSSCTNVTLSAGQSSCLSITLTEIDAGSIDFSSVPGACGSAADCSTVHGLPQCAGGTCSWTCDSGWGHCQTGNTGCETDLTSIDNCGACGGKCGTANATTNRCMAGQCAYDCMPGFFDCIKLGVNDDGCESDSHLPTSCGACGNVCDTTHSVVSGCDGTVCMYSGCMPGYADCDAAGANANGCEFMDATHQVGINSLTYFLACTPLGTPGSPATYTLTMSQTACGAWTTSVGGGTCDPATCTGNTNCTRANFGGTCVTWCYTKSTSGYVSSGAACSCPNTASPTWN